MKKAKAKLDKLNEVFLPVKTMKENFEAMKKALKKLKAAKSNLQNMKLVVENNAKIKKESGDLEKTEKIVANKMTLREKDKALAAVTEKVNKAVIEESAKEFK